MTTPANQTQPQTKTIEAKSEFEMLLEKDSRITASYKPYGGEQDISLSIAMIRRYIATPYVSDDKEWHATDEECTRFLLMCRQRRLDPWTGDAYMVPFWDKRIKRPAWSLITSHAAFLKRAEVHADFDGMESGVIVKDSGSNLVERDGDFLHPGDTLLGGWATVYKKTKAHPKKIKVNLDVYKKPFGVWLGDSAGMICKVAEAQAIRDSFPSQNGDMYLREEMKELQDILPPSEQQEIKKPALISETPIPKKNRDAKGRPTLVEEPLDTPKPVEEAKPEPKPEPEKPIEQPAQAEPEPLKATEASPEAELLELCKAHNITPAQLNKYLLADKWIKPPQTKLQEMATAKIAKVVEFFKKDEAGFAKRILGKQ